MKPIPRTINTWNKLQYLLTSINEAVEAGESFDIAVGFYTPWDKISKKLKNVTTRVNLFEVPEAYHIIKDTFNGVPPLNRVPTVVFFSCKEPGTLEIRVTDNNTAIQNELGFEG